MNEKIFSYISKIIFENEGIYSNDPDDPGAETFMGISRKYHPNWPGWKYVDELKEQGIINKIDENFIKNSKLYNLVLDFYFVNYWKKLHLDVLDFNLAILLFDSAINLGKKTAVKLLQRILGVKDDGIIGTQTLGAIKNFENDELLKEKYKLKRIEHYINLCYKNKNLRKYLLGWLNRVLKF